MYMYCFLYKHTHTHRQEEVDKGSLSLNRISNTDETFYSGTVKDIHQEAENSLVHSLVSMSFNISHKNIAGMSKWLVKRAQSPHKKMTI